MNRIIELIFCMVECYKGIYGITEPVNITNKFYENEKDPSKRKEIKS